MYPRIFSLDVLSPMLIEKSKILVIQFFFFFFFLFLSIGLERDNVTLSTTIFCSFCWHMQRPLGICGPPAITTTSKHVWRQLPFLSKSYLYLSRKSGTKFPTDWRNKFFIRLRIKNLLVLKILPVWSLLGMKSKPDFVAARAFHPVIWHLKRRKTFLFLFFFYFTQIGPPTFKSGYTHSEFNFLFNMIQKKCSLLHRVTFVSLCLFHYDEDHDTMCVPILPIYIIWPSLAIFPYRSSPLAGLQGYILYPHRAAVWSSVYTQMIDA